MAKLMTGAQIMEHLRYQIEDVCMELMSWYGDDHTDEIKALNTLKKSITGWVFDWTTPAFDIEYRVASGYHYAVVTHKGEEFVSPLWVPAVHKEE